MCAGAMLRPTASVFGISKDFSDIINSAVLHVDRSGRLGITAVEICRFPLKWSMALTAFQALPRWQVIDVF
jgi:hypothetical protein